MNTRATLRLLLLLSLIIGASHSFGLVVPVAEDTSANLEGKLTPVTGAASSLVVTASQAAFLHFQLSDPAVVPANFHYITTTSATLQITLVSAHHPGDIAIRRVYNAWSEDAPATQTAVLAQASAPIATIPAASLVGKRCITVDLLPALSMAGGYGLSDVSIALTTTDPGARVVFASKEGSPKGAAPQLDLEANLAQNYLRDVRGDTLTTARGIIKGDSGPIFACFDGGLFVGENAGGALLASNAPSSGATLNTAFGNDALALNAGDGNTAVGAEVLAKNTTGVYNSAFGVNALLFNINGNGNTAFGRQTLWHNISGTQNIAVGSAALSNNTTGGNNTAVGTAALLSAQTGSNNIALGSQAGSGITTGSYNIDLGNEGVAGEGNTIRLGTQGTHTAAYVAGIYGSTAASGVAVYVDANGHLGTLTSSARFKREIRPMAAASEAILGLQPVSFLYQKSLDPTSTPQFGLVAEQVAAVDPDLVARDAHGGIYTVRYEAVNAMLLNEFQKEHRRVQAQGETIASQQKQIGELSEQVGKMNALLEQLAAHARAAASRAPASPARP